MFPKHGDRGISRSAERGSILRRPRRAGQKEGTPSRGSSLLRLPLPPCSYPGGRNAPRSSPRLQRFENKRGPEWQPVRVDVRYPASGIECAICRARPCGCIHMARYSFSFSEHSQQEIGARSAPSLSGRNRGGNGSSKRVETPGGGVHPFCPAPGRRNLTPAPADFSSRNIL